MIWRTEDTKFAVDPSIIDEVYVGKLFQFVVIGIKHDHKLKNINTMNICSTEVIDLYEEAMFVISSQSHGPSFAENKQWKQVNWEWKNP